MKALSRDTWLALSLFALLALITAAAAATQTRAAQLPPLSSRSNQPDGAHALFLWLDRLGYRADDGVSQGFDLPANTRAVLVLEPTQPILEDEWQVLDEWVEDGGVLVLAGAGFTSLSAMRHYDVGLRFLNEPLASAAAAAPLLLSPPLDEPAEVLAEAYLETNRSDYAVHIAAAEGPVVISWPQGRGRVIVSASTYPFTNLGLKAPGNPQLALSLISSGRRLVGRVWFDEWHHGQRGDRSRLAGPADWLRFTPAGRALLYVAAVVFVALLLGGRRFGRPTALPSALARRTPLEYVTAIASLSRRAGHRRAVLLQYRQALKRHLGRRYRLDPTLEDDVYVKRLAGLDPALEAPALARLLARLRAPRVGEREMVELAAETAVWTKEHA